MYAFAKLIVSFDTTTVTMPASLVEVLIDGIRSKKNLYIYRAKWHIWCSLKIDCAWTTPECAMEQVKILLS